MWRITRYLLFVVLAIAMVLAISFTAPAQQAKKGPDASDPFFDRGEIPQLKLEIAPANLDKLRGDPRNYVRCTLTENGKTIYKGVGVKLKGAAGSFRGVDDRPALTLNLDKYEKGQKFHDLDKFHLNNSVQDETYLHELICSDLCRKVGVPATRVTHARVWLNERDLGLYVLKEGFDKHFLGRYYPQTNGNLYDGGFLQDIDAPLQKDSGEGDDNREDLRELVAACREPDMAKRQAKLESMVDIEEFLGFVAMEAITCHWDGYIHNRNNYRIYFQAPKQKAAFFPHGMDQMFGNPGFGLFDIPGTIVTSGVLQCPEFNLRYRKKVNQFTANITATEPLLKKVDEVQARLLPVLTAMNPDLARAHGERAKNFKNQLLARADNIRLQLSQQPLILEFDAQGRFLVTNWRTAIEAGNVRLTEDKAPDGRDAYLIQTNPGERCVASWRRSITLPQGRYQFQAVAQTADVAEFQDVRGQGAGVRTAGENRTNKLVGTANWSKLESDLTITEPQRQVDLVMELRATQGKVWFAKEALRIVKLP